MIIGICGGTGSGKTTIARSIVKAIGEDRVILIEQDSYYRNMADMPLDERHKANYDHPDSIDADLFFEHLKLLKAGQAVEMPLYDYKTHTRFEKTEYVEPKPVVLVEGILIFAEPRIASLLDLRVFVDTPDDIRFIRRLQRDIKERGRTVESVIDQYHRSVRPMHHKFVAPSKRMADIVLPETGQMDVVIDLLCGMIRDRLAGGTETAAAGSEIQR